MSQNSLQHAVWQVYVISAVLTLLLRPGGTEEVDNLSLLVGGRKH